MIKKRLTKKLFMLKKLIVDITRGDNFYLISKEIHENKLGKYYLIFDEKSVRGGKDQALITSFDKDGIPLNNTYIDVESDKLVYFPISIGQLGLAVFHTFLKTKSKNDFDRFIRFVDWFKNNATLDKETGARWLTDVPLPAYNNSGPWQSAFAQSRAISILLRGFQITNNQKYKDLADEALKSFLIPVSRGGVTSFTDWGPFYEEYTSTFPILVFNGHIFSLLGLYDFIRVDKKNEIAREAFESGMATLINALPAFDLGYWTRYNYCQQSSYPLIDPATLSYQRLHVMLLKIINLIRPNKLIENTIKHWTSQIGVYNFFKAAKIKYSALKKLNRV